MSRLTVTLLGGFELTLGSGEARVLPARKAEALLAYLAVEPGRRYSRDMLAALLWGDREDARARKSLRQTIYSLRKALPDVTEPLFVMHGGGIALNSEVIDADVPRFERLVREDSPEALERAATLYRGDLLHGFRLEETGVEEWLVAQRERLRVLAIEGLGKLLAHQARTTATEQAIATAVRLLGLDPLQETVHRTLMRLYARQGRHATALRQYQICIDVLQRELRAEPEIETRQLYQELLQQRRRGRGHPEAASQRSALRPRSSAPSERPQLPVHGAQLIGREAELERLRGLARHAEEGAGSVAIILGEAGIGKSRLLSEIASEAAERGSSVMFGCAFESEQLLAFGPWAAAVRSSRALEEPGALEALAPAWQRELGRLFPEIGDSVAVIRTGEENHRRLFEALERLFSILAEQRPLILVLEDFHWADDMSLRFLSYLGRRIDRRKVLILASARQEELMTVPALRRAIEELLPGSRCLELALGPLSRHGTIDLVRALIRSGEQPSGDLEERIWTASEGNPFMVVQIVRALEQDSDVLPATPLPVPDGVQKLIAGRLDRVSARGQHVTAVAAVIGRDFEFSLLQRAAGLSARDAAEAVEELVRRRVLHGAGERLDFTHDRIRDVAYVRLLPATRQVLHREVVDALEALKAGGEQVEGLGHHALRAGLWDKAVRYLGQAATRAMTRSAYREAAAFLERALEAVQHLEGTPELLAQVIDLRLSLRTSMVAAGKLADSVEHLRRAETLALRLGDRQRLGRVLTLSINSHYLLGSYGEAMAAARRALSIAAELRDERLEATANLFVGQIHFQQGEITAGAELLRGVVDRGGTGEDLGVAGLRVAARLVLSWCLTKLGRFDESVAYAQEAVDLARERGRPTSLVAAYLGLMIPYLYRGDRPEAIGLGEQAVALCEQVEAPVLLPMIQSQLGHGYMLADRAAEALHFSEAAERGWAANGVVAGYSIPLRFLAETYRAIGRIDDARHAAARAYEVASLHNEVDHQAEALRVLGDIAAASATLADAERHYRDALALAIPRGTRPLAAHCRLGLAQLYYRTGKLERAHKHFTTATTMYREMGMTYWLQRAEAEMAA